MELQRITEAWNEQFQTRGQCIVFWHDPEQEFEDLLSGLTLNRVTVLRLDQQAALAVKVRLEQNDAAGRYLLYATFDSQMKKAPYLSVFICVHLWITRDAILGAWNRPSQRVSKAQR